MLKTFMRTVKSFCDNFNGIHANYRGMGGNAVNDVFKNIYLRRSVRDYKPNDVPDDILKELIKAGTYAPTAVNKQPWRFVVVKNMDTIRRLSDRAKKLWLDNAGKVDDPHLKQVVGAMKMPEFNIFYNAPVLDPYFCHARCVFAPIRLRPGRREHDARRPVAGHRQLLDRVRHAAGLG